MVETSLPIIFGKTPVARLTPSKRLLKISFFSNTPPEKRCDNKNERKLSTGELILNISKHVECIKLTLQGLVTI